MKQINYLKFIVPIISFVLSIGLFLTVDFLLPSPPYGANPVFKTNKFGWLELAPNFKGRTGSIVDPWEVFTDSNGFVSSRSSTTTSPKEFIFLGDSFTFGAGPWEETFVGIFQENSKKSVLNGGIPSHSPTMYLYQSRKILNTVNLHPKPKIIIGVDISDVSNEAKLWWSKELTSNTNLKQLDYLSNLLSKIQSNLTLTEKLRRSFKTTESNSVFELKMSAFTFQDWKNLNKYYTPLGVQGGLERISYQLKQIGKLYKNSNAEIYYLAYPWPAQIMYKDKFSWPEWLVTICKANNCSGVIDTFPTFRELSITNKNWVSDYYLPNDPHFTAKGNLLVAKELLKYFKFNK